MIVHWFPPKYAKKGLYITSVGIMNIGGGKGGSPVEPSITNMFQTLYRVIKVHRGPKH